MAANLDTIFMALSDPTRRAILARLTEGEASVADLAEPFALTPRAISKHIAVLETAGLVTRSRESQRRPAHLRIEPLIEVDEWLKGYRKLWDDRFDRLEQQLRKQQKSRNRKKGSAK